MPEALLPTAVVGSYSMPAWLERVKNDYLLRRISRHDLDEIHDMAVKAAIKDQEVAGVDVVSDGELRRDNMIDHFATRLPGVEIDHVSKKFYYDFYDSVIRARMPTASLGLCDEFRFLRRFTERQTKFSVTGPHSLVKRIRDEHYHSEEALALDIARVMNLELRELCKAGATDIQIDEPYYSGFPEDLSWGIRAINAMVAGVDARIGLHVCYGNRYGKPAWEGSYRYLVPGGPGGAGPAAHARVRAARGGGPPALQGLRPAVHPRPRRHRREEPRRRDPGPGGGADPGGAGDRPGGAPRRQSRLRAACICPRDVAFAKLAAMVEGTRLVRAELRG